MPVLKTSLSSNQRSKFHRGNKIRLSFEQLTHGGPDDFHLRPNAARRVHTALRHERGIVLSHHDVEEVGGSLASLYKEHVKPHVRSMLHKGVSALTPQLRESAQHHLSGLVGNKASSRLASAIDPAFHHAINRVGDATGAWGLRRGRRRLKRKTGGRLTYAPFKPLVRRGLKTAASLGATYFGVPEAIAPANAIIDAVGDSTHAWGFGHSGHSAGRRAGSKIPIKAGVFQKGTGFGHSHPGAAKKAASRIPIRAGFFQKGGSFKAAGY